MDPLTAWSRSEKKIAHAIFQRALEEELAQLLDDFKRRAADAKSPGDIWAIRDHLNQAERTIQRKFDYRYAQLLWVFTQLLREGRITQDQIAGLSDEKRDYMERTAALLEDGQAAQDEVSSGEFPPRDSGR